MESKVMPFHATVNQVFYHPISTCFCKTWSFWFMCRNGIYYKRNRDCVDKYHMELRIQRSAMFVHRKRGILQLPSMVGPCWFGLIDGASKRHVYECYVLCCRNWRELIFNVFCQCFKRTTFQYCCYGKGAPVLNWWTIWTLRFVIDLCGFLLDRNGLLLNFLTSFIVICIQFFCVKTSSSQQNGLVSWKANGCGLVARLKQGVYSE